jgi:ATP-dependent protease ClpP protease subunit
MPYKCKKVGNKWVVHKHTSKGNWVKLQSSGDHGSLVECNRQVKALYANEPEVRNEVKVDLIGPVDGWMADLVAYKLHETDDTIRVNISSKGGDYFKALEIYNMLRESGKRVITSAQGLCASAGAVILLAGDEIEAAKNSIIVFHMPQVMPNQPLGTDELEKTKQQLTTAEASLIVTLQDRTGWDETECKDFLKEEAYLTPEDAENMKLIDRILPFVRKKVEVNPQLPAVVLNSINTMNMEVDLMNLKELCGKLSLQVQDNATEDGIVDLVTLHVKGLADQLMKVTTELEATKKLVPPKPVELPAGIMNILKRNREGEINSLAVQGKITPAVAKDLVAVYAQDQHIKKYVDENGVVNDTFDSVLASLGKNEKVISFGSQTGLQTVPKPEDGAGTVDVLVRDAEKRSKK